MAISSAPPLLSPADGYRHWADSYDREPNPMLSLERRILEPLLPALKGLDILDLGCGTGRWLEILRGHGARSLTGVDFSLEMLRLADWKLGANAKIIHADCASPNLPSRSADLILCNFVLSYLPDPASFLKAAGILLRPAGSLFITDLHPQTGAALGWRRGTSIQGQFREIRNRQHLIKEILASCREANLEVSAFLQPRFGEEERAIFERNGKAAYFEEIRELPSIYVLQVALRDSSRDRNSSRDGDSPIVLQGVRVALDASAAQQANVRIADRVIDTLIDPDVPSDCVQPHARDTNIDLTGYLLLPGLINAHDHLEFALFPRLGKGSYSNFLEWVDDIYHPSGSPIAEHRQVPRPVRLWWGVIRNLLCGVTTVCHHNPFDPELFNDDFAIRVLRDYGWAHSLALDSDALQKKAATPEGQPFFVHLAEGIDASSSREIYSLHHAGALDSDTVIIHGLGMDSHGRDLFRASRAGLVWCPTSNIFLFGRTFSAAEIRGFPRVALGSDSPLTAAGDLLDEVSSARRLLDASPVDLYHYVTQQAANILALRNGEGTVRVGAIADLIAVRDTGLTPAETLAQLSCHDIELILLAGRVQLASQKMKERLPAQLYDGLQTLTIEGTTRWVRAPLDSLFAATTPHLGRDVRLGGKRVQLGK